MAEQTRIMTIEEAQDRIRIGQACAIADFGNPDKLTTKALVDFELWQNRYSNLLLGLSDKNSKSFQALKKAKRLEMCERLKLSGIDLDIAPVQGTWLVFEQD